MPSRPDRLLLQPRLLIISVAILLAAGFGLTLLIFYPGVMTYDAKFVYQDIAKGTMGDWQSPVMVWLWAPDRSDRSRRRQYVPADCRDLLAGLWRPLACARIPRQGQRVAVASAGNDAAGPVSCRDHLAGCPVCNVLVARRDYGVRGVWTSVSGQVDRAGAGACAGYIRGPAEAERLAGCADTLRLHCLAVASLPAQSGHPLRPGRDWVSLASCSSSTTVCWTRNDSIRCKRS